MAENAPVLNTRLHPRLLALARREAAERRIPLRAIIEASLSARYDPEHAKAEEILVLKELRSLDLSHCLKLTTAAFSGLLQDLSHLAEFEYAIINNDFDEARQDLLAIIRAARLRLQRQLQRHPEIFRLRN